MSSKNQGEGDYESAREYNRDTKKFVDGQREAGKEIRGSATDASDSLTPAEQEALKRAKHGEQDQRDADLIRAKETER
ncbi:MAG TPA: hypothetical protein VJQ47_00930 [Steroidobacteraceae bacterium]|nr:hypothetical protein [Steroidobacteraceae bacterium]